MGGAAKLIGKVKKRVEAAAFSSPLYRLVLDKGPVPERLRLSISDPWPGSSAAGEALMAKPLSLFDEAAHVPSAERRLLAAHAWLRDLRAVGTEAARVKAVALLQAWLDGYDDWQEESWSLDVLGDRIANWISFFDFYAPAADEVFSQRLIASMVRQMRHLLHALPSMPSGIEGLLAIKGLVYGGLGLIEGERSLGLALELLRRLLAAEHLPDGGFLSRNPTAYVRALRCLIDIRAALRATRYEVPAELTSAIVRLVPVVKFFRHGDGGLALFNGSSEGNAFLIDAILSLAEAKGRALRRLPLSEYERVTAGRSLLLMDVGAPPKAPFDKVAHAGLFSFEFSVGRERLIVNCGAGPEEVGDWRAAMAASAAHSALVVDDRNAAEVLPDGGIGSRPSEVVAQRYEQDGSFFVEAAHNGYERDFRLLYRRMLRLTEDGDELRGEEILAGPPGIPFAIRWHLHPLVDAALLQTGRSVLLRLPSGAGWRLRVEKADLVLEPSLYVGSSSPRRTLQLRAAGVTGRGSTTVSWILSREKKAG